MSILRKSLAALAGAAVLGLPLAVAAPASAYTTSNGCSVYPDTPVFDHLNDKGNKVIEYPIHVLCDGDRTIEIQDQRWEEDWTSADDPHGTTTYTITFTEFNSAVRSVTKTLPDGDPWGDNNEEMYHSVRFRVTGTLDHVTSPWTAWEKSEVVTFHR